MDEERRDATSFGGMGKCSVKGEGEEHGYEREKSKGGSVPLKFIDWRKKKSAVLTKRKESWVAFYRKKTGVVRGGKGRKKKKIQGTGDTICGRGFGKIRSDLWL